MQSHTARHDHQRTVKSFNKSHPLISHSLPPTHTVLIYIRFRQVTKTTQSALSGNRLAQSRSQRARRRLYLMVISILTPFLPIVLALAVLNIILVHPLQPFDFHAIHNHGPGDIPWNAVVYLPSTNISWAYMNICYIPIVTAVPIFVFFGMTKDAMNCYRVVLLSVGLGKLFPRLHEEYNPDSRAMASSSNGGSSNFTTSSRYVPALFIPPVDPNRNKRHTCANKTNSQILQRQHSLHPAIRNLNPSPAPHGHHSPHPQQRRPCPAP